MYDTAIVIKVATANAKLSCISGLRFDSKGLRSAKREEGLCRLALEDVVGLVGALLGPRVGASAQGVQVAVGAVRGWIRWVVVVGGGVVD
jgi:hypothetical protein